MNNPNYYFAVRWLEAQGVSENEWGYLCDKIREAINIDEFTKEELENVSILSQGDLLTPSETNVMLRLFINKNIGVKYA
jgi:hypothetical protein